LVKEGKWGNRFVLFLSGMAFYKIGSFFFEKFIVFPQESGRMSRKHFASFFSVSNDIRSRCSLFPVFRFG